MGTPRPNDTGQRDKLGRPIKTADPAAHQASVAGLDAALGATPLDEPGSLSGLLKGQVDSFGTEAEARAEAARIADGSPDPTSVYVFELSPGSFTVAEPGEPLPDDVELHTKLRHVSWSPGRGVPLVTSFPDDVANDMTNWARAAGEWRRHGDPKALAEAFAAKARINDWVSAGGDPRAIDYLELTEHTLDRLFGPIDQHPGPPAGYPAGITRTLSLWRDAAEKLRSPQGRARHRDREIAHAKKIRRWAYENDANELVHWITVHRDALDARRARTR